MSEIEMPTSMTQELADKMTATECDIWNTKVLSSWMLLNQISEIKVTFSGYGDSGQVDDVSFDNNWQHPRKNDTIPHITRELFWNRETNERVTIGTFGMRPVADIAEAIAMQEAGASNVDWYNNEGGRGELILTPNGIGFEIGYYSRQYTQAEHYQHSLEERYGDKPVNRANLGLDEPEYEEY